MKGDQCDNCKLPCQCSFITPSKIWQYDLYIHREKICNCIFTKYGVRCSVTKGKYQDYEDLSSKYTKYGNESFIQLWLILIYILLIVFAKCLLFIQPDFYTKKLQDWRIYQKLDQ